MKYTQAQIEAGIKFLNNANVHIDTAELEDKVVNININVGKRKLVTLIWLAHGMT